MSVYPHPVCLGRLSGGAHRSMGLGLLLVGDNRAIPPDSQGLPKFHEHRRTQGLVSSRLVSNSVIPVLYFLPMPFSFPH